VKAQAQTAGVEVTISLSKEEVDSIRTAVTQCDDLKTQILHARLGEMVWRSVYDVVMRTK
jgi:hypothetical protein